MGMQRRQHLPGRLTFNGNDQLAFVCEVKRIQTQQFTYSTNGRFHGKCGFGQLNAKTAGGSKLMGDRVHAATRRVAQGFHAGDIAQRLN